MKLADLLASQSPVTTGAVPVVNPLSGADLFQEAQLLDVRFDALRMTAGVLLEQRIALQLREANTGVLICRSVRRIDWSAGPRATPLTAWNVVGSSILGGDGTVELRLGLFPEAELVIRAEQIEFYNCEVDEIGGIPDYGDETVPVHASLASWDSQIDVVGASRIDAREGE
ncbi:MAG: hypothetical protein GY701_35300 [Sulfitobacter sp.]|nr:hypothetical protein [Sulfitobacter sp.]